EAELEIATAADREARLHVGQLDRLHRRAPRRDEGLRRDAGLAGVIGNTKGSGARIVGRARHGGGREQRHRPGCDATRDQQLGDLPGEVHFAPLWSASESPPYRDQSGVASPSRASTSPWMSCRSASTSTDSPASRIASLVI